MPQNELRGIILVVASAMRASAGCPRLRGSLTETPRVPRRALDSLRPGDVERVLVACGRQARSTCRPYHTTVTSRRRWEGPRANERDRVQRVPATTSTTRAQVPALDSTALSCATHGSRQNGRGAGALADGGFVAWSRLAQAGGSRRRRSAHRWPRRFPPRRAEKRSASSCRNSDGRRRRWSARGSHRRVTRAARMPCMSASCWAARPATAPRRAPRRHAHRRGGGARRGSPSARGTAAARPNRWCRRRRSVRRRPQLRGRELRAVSRRPRAGRGHRVRASPQRRGSRRTRAGVAAGGVATIVFSSDRASSRRWSPPWSTRDVPDFAADPFRERAQMAALITPPPAAADPDHAAPPAAAPDRDHATPPAAAPGPTVPTAGGHRVPRRSASTCPRRASSTSPDTRSPDDAVSRFSSRGSCRSTIRPLAARRRAVRRAARARRRRGARGGGGGEPGRRRGGRRARRARDNGARRTLSSPLSRASSPRTSPPAPSARASSAAEDALAAGAEPRPRPARAAPRDRAARRSRAVRCAAARQRLGQARRARQSKK